MSRIEKEAISDKMRSTMSFSFTYINSKLRGEKDRT